MLFQQKMICVKCKGPEFSEPHFSFSSHQSFGIIMDAREAVDWCCGKIQNPTT